MLDRNAGAGEPTMARFEVEYVTLGDGKREGKPGTTVVEADTRENAIAVALDQRPCRIAAARELDQPKPISADEQRAMVLTERMRGAASVGAGGVRMSTVAGGVLLARTWGRSHAPRG